jgi:hypothetical protein
VSKVYHDEPNAVFVYVTIMRSPMLMQLAYEVLEQGMHPEEFTAIFIEETGEFVDEDAVREGLLKFADEEHGPFSAVDIQDVRRRLEEEE